MTRVLASVVAVLALVALPTTAGAADAADDQQIADDSVLTIDDVPSVFHEITPDDSDEAPSGKACAAIRRGRDLLNDAPNAEVEFETDPTDAGGARINNKVSVFAKTKQAKKAIASYSTERTGDCFTDTYEEIFGAQDPDATVDVSVDQYLPDLGDTAIGFQVQIDASAQGESRSYYLDLELVRVGRGVSAFAFLNSGSEPPSDDVVAMTEEGVDRLTKAL